MLTKKLSRITSSHPAIVVIVAGNSQCFQLKKNNTKEYSPIGLKKFILLQGPVRAIDFLPKKEIKRCPFSSKERGPFTR